MSVLGIQMIQASVTEGLEILHVGLREYASNYWNVVEVMAVAALVSSAHALVIVYQAGAAYFNFNGYARDLECRLPGARVCELYQTVQALILKSPLIYALKQYIHQGTDFSECVLQLLAAMKYFMLNYGLFTGLHTLKALKYASLFPELDIPFQALMKVTHRLGTLTLFMIVVGFAMSIGTCLQKCSVCVTPPALSNVVVCMYIDIHSYI